MQRSKKSRPASDWSHDPDGCVNAAYRGRFAPSPTGPLHLGSLLTAVASFLDARANRGAWLVRIEDLDPPREPRGAAQSILTSLQRHGLHPDESIVFQSERGNLYGDTLFRLQATGCVYACPCSRKELAHARRHRDDCGYWRVSQQDSADIAQRLRLPTGKTVFRDSIQGEQEWSWPDNGLADCVLKRKEGFYAYALAVVADDMAQGITHVIRGADLLPVTAEQHFLYDQLGWPRPLVGHIPLLTDSAGVKLSKQNLAPALDDQHAMTNLRDTLQSLRIPLCEPLTRATTPEALLEAAIPLWDPRRLTGISSISQSDGQVEPS